MKFPSLVYRCPGTHQIRGGTYDYLGVKDQESLSIALGDGWYETLAEAIERHYGKKDRPGTVIPTKVVERGSGIHDTEVLGDGEPPTRAELEKQATELGVKFSGKTSDKDLLKKIDESMQGSAPTRDELEEQATQLGVKFTSKTTDEELVKKIDEALGE